MVMCMVMLLVIWCSIYDCGLLVMLLVIFMSWLIGFGCSIVVFLLVCVRCLWVRLYCVWYCFSDGIRFFFMCLCCRCSIISVLMFFSIVLKLLLIM